MGYKAKENFSSKVMRVTHSTYLPDPIDKKRRYHIHIYNPKSPVLKKVLLFRDYLRKYPEDVKKYAETTHRPLKPRWQWKH